MAVMPFPAAKAASTAASLSSEFPRPPDRLSASRAPLAGSGNAATDALNDHGPLELGEHAEHLKHRLAARDCRIEPLLMQIQVNAFGVQIAEERHEVL